MWLEQRERLDISEEKLLLYFWDCWHQLKDKITEELPMPPLFQFLTVLAFKIFICEKVDVAIIEVGLGGTRDSTNVIKDPVVCGITSLGMDHIEALGDTLGEIASHKAGIFKPNVPGFTAPQLPEAMDVIEERAQQLGIPLEVASPLRPGLKLSLAGDHQLINAGLAIALCKSWIQQTGNWGKVFTNDDYGADLPEAFLRGLSSARLSGRAQIVIDTVRKSSNMPSGDLVFHLDGAHSPESMEACARWFSEAVKQHKNSIPLSPLNLYCEDELNGHGQNGFGHSENGCNYKNVKQILLFNCMDVRNPNILLQQLVGTCASSGVHFSKALFVPSMSTYNKVTSPSSITCSDEPTTNLSWQFDLQNIWEKIINGNDLNLNGNCREYTVGFRSLEPENYSWDNSDVLHPTSAVIPSLPLALKWLRDCVKDNPSLKLQVLVTGSMHLVGDVLKLLRR